MNKIITHYSVDLDSITSSWLIKRYLPNWENSEIIFVPAGKTLNDETVDSNKSIIHVDTGFGKFDHHQKNDYTSAAKKVFQHLVNEAHIPLKIQTALEKLVTVVNEIDHFEEVNYPDAASDRYDFLLSQIIEGLKTPLKKDDKIVEMGHILLDAVLHVLKNKVSAEEAIKKGFVFQSRYGKSLAISSPNEEAVKLSLKMGYSLVVRKEPVRGHARIKTLPKKELDLTPIYEEIIKRDKKATWFLHVSKNMLLNSSSKNPNFIATSLSLQQLIEIIKKI